MTQHNCVSHIQYEIKIIDLRNLTPCNMADVYRRLEKIYCFHHLQEGSGSRFPKNVLPQPRTVTSTCSAVRTPILIENASQPCLYI